MNKTQGIFDLTPEQSKIREEKDDKITVRQWELRLKK